MRSVFDAVGEFGLPGLLRSLATGAPIRSKEQYGTRSALLRMHNEVARREVSRYPNPVPPTGATFVVSLPWPADLDFRLYDLRGELVWTMSRNCPASGNYQQFWGAVNDSGAKVSYGAFYLVARAYDSSRNEFDKRWITVIR